MLNVTLSYYVILLLFFFFVKSELNQNISGSQKINTISNLLERILAANKWASQRKELYVRSRKVPVNGEYCWHKFCVREWREGYEF